MRSEVMMEKRIVEIVETATGKVVKTVDVSGHGSRGVEKVEDGMNRNLDHERFFTRIVPPLPPEKGKVDR
jgi:hypothetical protein